ERLLELGATRVDWRYPPGADYVVLADPDGNKFCVIDAADYFEESSGLKIASIPNQHDGDHGTGAPGSQVPLPSPDAFAARSVRALVVLQERQLREFVPVWREAKARALSLPETDDTDYDSLE